MYYLLKTLAFLNSILFVIVVVIIISNFTKRQYPGRKAINKAFSKIQVPFDDQYKIFFLLLVPIVIGFLITALWKLLLPTGYPIYY